MMMTMMRKGMQMLMLTGTIFISIGLSPIQLSIFASPHVWAASSPSQPTIKGNSEAGRKIYNGKGFCYKCHGFDGYLDRRPPMGPEMRRMIDQLNPKPADFRNPATLKSKNDEERFDTIRNGHRGTAMFPHESLEGAEINDILAYLSVLRSEGTSQAQGGGKTRK